MPHLQQRQQRQQPRSHSVRSIGRCAVDESWPSPSPRPQRGRDPPAGVVTQQRTWSLFLMLMGCWLEAGAFLRRLRSCSRFWMASKSLPCSLRPSKKAAMSSGDHCSQVRRRRSSTAPPVADAPPAVPVASESSQKLSPAGLDRRRAHHLGEAEGNWVGKMTSESPSEQHGCNSQPTRKGFKPGLKEENKLGRTRLDSTRLPEVVGSASLALSTPVVAWSIFMALAGRCNDWSLQRRWRQLIVPGPCLHEETFSEDTAS